MCRQRLLTVGLGLMVIALACAGCAQSGPSQDSAPGVSPMSQGGWAEPTTAPKTTLVTGTVCDAAGNPISGCLVTIEGRNQEKAIKTNVGGMFKEYFIPGENAVVIQCDTGRYQTAREGFVVLEGEEQSMSFTVEKK